LRRDYLNIIAKNSKIFTTRDARQLWKTNPQITNNILHHFENKGWLERIEKGKYLIIPLGSNKGEYTLNEFVIGSVLVETYCVAYWSALHFHAMTEQIPRTVFIQTLSRKKKQKHTIFGVDYHIVRIDPGKFYGRKEFWIDETRIHITNREKTIIDCLDKPQYSGGIVEVAKALRNEELNLDMIAEYAREIKNSAVIRRLGYLCDILELNIGLSPPKVNNYLYLDPSMPKSGTTLAKWRLIDNLGPYILGELE